MNFIFDRDMIPIIIGLLASTLFILSLEGLIILDFLDRRALVDVDFGLSIEVIFEGAGRPASQFSKSSADNFQSENCPGYLSKYTG